LCWCGCFVYCVCFGGVGFGVSVVVLGGCGVCGVGVVDLVFRSREC